MCVNLDSYWAKARNSSSDGGGVTPIYLPAAVLPLSRKMSPEDTTDCNPIRNQVSTKKV